jgi:hypothetical protein
MFKVYKNSCKNCLLSKNRIVSSARAKEIIKTCANEQTFFVCHKATIENKNICCKTFYDKFSQLSKLATFAKGVNCVEFVEQTDSEKMPTHKEMNLK